MATKFRSGMNRAPGMLASFALVAAQIAPVPAILAPVGAASVMAQQNRQTIGCFSQGFRPNTCPLPANTVAVSFIGPDRTGRCIQGQTWAQRGNGLWVSGGCGGSFEVITQNSGGGWGGGNPGGGWGGGNQGGNWGGPGWGGSGGNWNNQGFAGEITCRSQNNRTQTCYANTQGRVEMLQQYSNTRCVEGQNWRYNRDRIEVRNGCQARFGYGVTGNQGGGWGGGNNQGFAGTVDCRSQNNRQQRCNVYTNNRVQMLQQYSNTTCIQNRNWGYDRNGIWVNNGCQARFGYGTGNYWDGGSGSNPGSGSSGGSNAGGIIAGGLLAAGLVALLSQAGKGDRSGEANRTATVEADFNSFPSASRDSARACMNEAARQIGATGGTKVRLTSVDAAQQSGGGWMILARLSATYDDHIQAMTMDCRATGGKVTAFDVR